MTKDELKQRIIPRLASKYRQELSLADVGQAFQGAPLKQRTAIVAALSKGDAETAGRVLLSMVNTLMSSYASTEADTMLADDQMSLAEIERAFQ